jgi:cytochrome c oxidase assembly factor CtaG
VSRAAAIGFARSELHAFAGAVIEMAASPLVATISFAPVQPWETARDHRKAA